MSKGNPRELVDELAILMATVRALLVSTSATRVLLENYDSASRQVLTRLGHAGFSAEDLMQLERNLARLRVALEERAER